MNWYPLLNSLAIAAGGAIMIAEGRRQKFETVQWSFVVLAWAIGGVVGAHLPRAILGDLAAARTAVGAVAGATVALILATRLVGIETARGLDTTATAIPLAGALARLGCFAAECCEGIATRLPLGVMDGDGIRRHPTQLYEAAFDIAVASWISRSAPARLGGHRFLLSLGVMSIGRFAIEFVRDSEKLGGLSLAQWVTAPIAGLCLVMVGRAFDISRAARRFPLAATGATALALQMPVISADSTYPRIYTGVGVGYFGASFDMTHDNGSCDAEEDWDRHHSIRGGAIEVGMRRLNSATQSVGFRTRAFSATERASGSSNHQPSGVGSPLAGYTHNHNGLSLIGDFDFRYLGVSVGATLGNLYPIIEAGGGDIGGRGVKHAWFAGGVRVGPERSAVEIRFGDEQPSGQPLPGLTAGLAFANDQGTRLRFGMSEVGPFVSGRHVLPSGLEFNPLVAAGGGQTKGGLHAGLMVRKWFRTDPKP